jgi:hypothetical protein
MKTTIEKDSPFVPLFILAFSLEVMELLSQESLRIVHHQSPDMPTVVIV